MKSISIPQSNLNNKHIIKWIPNLLLSCWIALNLTQCLISYISYIISKHNTQDLFSYTFGYFPSFLLMTPVYFNIHLKAKHIIEYIPLWYCCFFFFTKLENLNTSFIVVLASSRCTMSSSCHQRRRASSTAWATSSSVPRLWWPKSSRSSSLLSITEWTHCLLHRSAAEPTVTLITDQNKGNNWVFVWLCCHNLHSEPRWKADP